MWIKCEKCNRYNNSGEVCICLFGNTKPDEPFISPDKIEFVWPKTEIVFQEPTPCRFETKSDNDLINDIVNGLNAIYNMSGIQSPTIKEELIYADNDELLDKDSI